MLGRRRVRVTHVETALRAQNLDLPAGYVQSQERDYQVRVERPFADSRCCAGGC